MINHVAILPKINHRSAWETARSLQAWFRDHNVSTHIIKSYPTHPCRQEGQPEEAKLDWQADLIVVLGGDGTLLGAARGVGAAGTPILGVNLGGLGFLTEIGLEELNQTLPRIISGDFSIESRMTLDAEVVRGDEVQCLNTVLNDVVINKAAIARIMELGASIDDEFVTTFRADGLIISTPTGSTAYNLAAGGPILYPTLESIILTPICPFTLSNRPLIIPDKSVVRIEIDRAAEHVYITYDGQVGLSLKPGDHVVVRQGQSRINLVKSPSSGYFKILRTKLKWG
ncbi:MAG: NAD(+)/NADH kinase [Deltaproteobacteria bacterium]|nr:NAD(+)/NADH kinase [Deltaproteobacteria bacterium]MBF0525100.1 NAD(+)/NADH kinase [Deltaproteobacteria bacterium]